MKAKISDRIAVLKEKLGGKSDSELEKGRDYPPKRVLSNGLLSDWLGKEVDWSSDKLEKFLTHWNINRAWWKTGEGEVFNQNGTHEQNGSDNSRKSLDEQKDIYKELYNKFIGEGSEYLLIHRDVLKEHRLVAVEQFEKDQKQMEQNAKELDRRTNELEGLREIIKELTARPINIQLPKVQKA